MTAADLPPAPSPSSAGLHGCKDWGRLFKATLQAWLDDSALRLSAALAYYSVFSIAPLLVITIAIAGLVFGNDAASGEIYKGLQGYIGSQAAAGVQAMVESASKPTSGVIATIVGSVTLLLGASGVLGQLKDALNTIWEVEVKKGAGIVFFIRSKFLNFGMVLVVGLLLFVSLLASSFLATLNQSMEQVLELPAWIWTVLASVISMGVATVLFAMLFKYLPDARIRWRDVWVGALITAGLFELGKFGLAWYLGRESTADAYGSAGAVVLLLLWIYYASCILLFGAEFTQEYAAARGHVIEPSPHARRVEEVKVEKTGGRKDELQDESEESDSLQTDLGAPQHAAQRHAEEPAVRHPQPHAERPSPPREGRPPLASAPPHHEGGGGSLFSHRLLDPVLKYLEGRGLLLSIESKEAVSQAAFLLIVAAVCGVTLFVAWSMLATALVGLLVTYFEWSWIKAVAITGGLHALVTVAGAALIWWKALHGTWFKETINELKKDRLWLRGKPH